jgi:hypothetical protein
MRESTSSFEIAKLKGKVIVHCDGLLNILLQTPTFENIEDICLLNEVCKDLSADFFTLFRGCQIRTDLHTVVP